MDINKNCTACDIKKKHKNKNWRSVCKDCYIKGKKRNIRKHPPNNDEDVMYISNINRTLDIGFSKCGETLPMKNSSYPNQGEVHIFTNSINQYTRKI